MQKNIRTRLSMAARAVDFAVAHPVADTGFAIVVQRLQGAVEHAGAAGMLQIGGSTDEASARARRSALREIIRGNYLRRLGRIAELATETHPELKGQFKLPDTRVTQKVFVLSAKNLLEATVEQREILEPLGLGATFIDDLTQAVTEIDGTTQQGHKGRAGHVGATVDLAATVKRCVHDVEILDTYYAAVTPRDPELLASWESARNVAGPFLRRVPDDPPPVIPPPEPQPVPAPVVNVATKRDQRTGPDEATGKEDAA